MKLRLLFILLFSTHSFGALHSSLDTDPPTTIVKMGEDYFKVELLENPGSQDDFVDLTRDADYNFPHCDTKDQIANCPVHGDGDGGGILFLPGPAGKAYRLYRFLRKLRDR